jgi:hypothetical protein
LQRCRKENTNQDDDVCGCGRAGEAVYHFYKNSSLPKEVKGHIIYRVF